MYTKIKKKSQLITLRSLNPYLGKYQIPREVLRELGKLQKCKCHGKKDYIAFFLEPVKNDSTEILDELQIYPAKAEFNDDNLYRIAVKGNKNVVWTCAELRIKKENQKVFVVYPMKQKYLDERGGY